MKKVELYRVENLSCLVWKVDGEVLGEKAAAYLLDSVYGIGADVLLMVSEADEFAAVYGESGEAAGRVLARRAAGEKAEVEVYLTDAFCQELKMADREVLSRVG